MESMDEAKKEHRRLVLRLRNRVKQKKRRDRYLNERERLLAQVTEMRSVLTELGHKQVVPTSLLPWKDVAGSLAQASVEARLSLQVLRDRCEAMYRLGRVMSAWVGSMSRRNNVPDVGRPFTSTPIVLLADAASRKLGLDWFTQHMYYNTDRMQQLCAFPSSGTVRDISVVDHENGVSDILGRIQIDCDLPLEATYAALHDKIWDELRGDTQAAMSEFLDADIIKSIDAKMVYRRTALTADESNYYVCREFATQDRIVFLFGNFSQDALQPENVRWRPRMFWYCLERLGAGHTRIKQILYNGPKVVHNQIVPWTSDADWISESFSDDPQFQQYERWVNKDWQPMLESDFAVLSSPRRRDPPSAP
ncbi:hypothetical protein SPRG_12822 [Saprolegnia parasitica CBS 223.65]|uniref:BZIP domain-containing protein n=1 Tax=Saprolegnia parasitica (strain CBS 223.65) TaxID=695850 RepID=A0A067BUK2_SAPPC|nr:hypothetical protein SPRG_12822 [Saprolegnia parasitica CBS 223.65]KDO21958.1 hypothetical protein SPRG_12822 [Saprolegnia parasitica CBS 223.65]|eukprot:XP_012207300.1 hypothetical protein SPRG_12822 [Saprolegnia parasitica CBS 223.65]